MDIKSFVAKIVLSGAAGMGIAYILTNMIDQQLVYVISIASALVAYSLLDNYMK